MGHEDEGDAQRALQRLQLFLHRFAQLQVQRPQRLVQQQHPRLHHQRPGQRHPLPLAARQLPRPPRAEPRQRDLRQRRLGRRMPRGVGPGPPPSARRPRCPARSDAGKGHSPERPCSPPPVGRHPAHRLPRRSRSRRRSAARTPRSAAGRWSCPTPTAPASQRTHPRRSPDRPVHRADRPVMPGHAPQADRRLRHRPPHPFACFQISPPEAPPPPARATSETRAPLPLPCGGEGRGEWGSAPADHADVVADPAVIGHAFALGAGRDRRGPEVDLVEIASPFAAQPSAVCIPEPSVQAAGTAGTEPNQTDRSDIRFEFSVCSIHM